MEWQFDIVFKHFPFLLDGIKWTVTVSIAGMLSGLVLGLLVALVRMSPYRILQFLSGLYIDIFRSTPLLAQLVWIYFALPILTGIRLGPLQAGILALCLYVSAYLAEIYRAGILSIAQGQTHAGLALGMTKNQVLGRVLLPQAVTRVLPPMASQFITLFKDSSLLYMISLPELMWQGTSLAAFTMRAIECMTVVALIYMALTIPQAICANWLHKKYLTH